MCAVLFTAVLTHMAASVEFVEPQEIEKRFACFRDELHVSWCSVAIVSTLTLILRENHLETKPGLPNRFRWSNLIQKDTSRMFIVVGFGDINGNRGKRPGKYGASGSAGNVLIQTLRLA